MKRGRVAIAVAAVAAVTVVGAGRGEAAPLVHRLSLSAAGEFTLRPDRGGHGVVVASYDLGGLPRDAHFVADFNTDTLRVGVDRIHFAGGRLEVGAVAVAELLIAGLLPDYIRDGVGDPARGFWASYVGAGGSLKYVAAPHFVELTAGARRWFFAPQGGTSPSLVLPPEAFFGELRLYYTYWALDGDPSLYERQRPFARLRGLAFGVAAGLDARSQAYPWGARSPTVFSPPDLRNDPSPQTWMVRVWLRAGRSLHPRLRLQLAEEATWMVGEDDLDRVRVGGMTPYAVPLAGAPWPAFLVGKLAAVEASLHVRAWRELEVGLLLDGAVIDDRARTGTSRPAALAGVGLFADFRWRAWQADARVGWSPTVTPGDRAAFGGFVDVGWSWQR
jgi:hypothetical protein